MLLGSKPLADLTEEEMRLAITELRASREALREDAIKRKKERDEGKLVPKERKAREPKMIKKEDSDLLAFLKGDKETL